MKKQIINIINFVRGVLPGAEMDYLVAPVKEQIRLMKKHSLKGTFLLQYDAMILDEYVEIFKALDSQQFELGIWHEIVQPLAEDCGMVWRGKYPWDWHTDCGFPVGYTKEEREKLVDAQYEKFKSIFGYYPRVFGSWFFDTHTARYIEERYGADAFCNCKEQYGTDGYTLWGGYYGQGYYPSCKNVFMPAGKIEHQIHIPLFRMLGSDHVYQYDYKIDVNRSCPAIQKVITLEPVCPENGGGNEAWVDWYMKENFNGECLSFGYAQAGQENTFGWQKMDKGLTYQFALFEKLRDLRKITVEKLGETGRWYKESYKETPASAIVAHTAFDSDKNSVWYSTKYFRINLYGEHNKMRIRDLHIFSDKYLDPYEDTVCTKNFAVYDTLPLIDGNRYTGKGILAGGYLKNIDGTEPQFEKMEFQDAGNGKAVITYGDIIVELQEASVKITGTKPFTLENRIGISGDHLPEIINVTSESIALLYNGIEYAVVLKEGKVLDRNIFCSEGNVMELVFRS